MCAEDESSAYAGRRPYRASAIEFSRLRPDVALVRPCRPLASGTDQELRRVVDDQLDTDPWAVLLDLTATALSPAAVAVLVEAAERAGGANVGLYLIVGDDAVAQALKAAGRLDLFDIYPTIESAVRAMSTLRSTG
ncbi:STAS domain-containing protein [Pseudonocardia acidicola]|uniref:STAS domain-containing protein n=1 Tax=Pseudonocardia acidicola TaxID=2724939 RepID=A0ABX1SKD6_9PSEU|nr:STAS domain-containing protein [Pseudonocardia acidicola]NMI00969.1 STAS domain-containing protein [Pseudonocardia acidicola]